MYLFINLFIYPFADNPSLLSHVPVTIQVLDINDNPPEINTDDEIVICEGIRAGQVSLTKATPSKRFNTEFIFKHKAQLEYSKKSKKGKERGRERLKLYKLSFI